MDSTGDAIHWFLTHAITIYDEQSTIPSGARVTYYSGALRFTARWPLERDHGRWTWGVTDDVLHGLADFTEQREEYRSVEVLVTSPDSSLFKFTVSKPPSTALTIEIGDLYTEISYWVGHILSEDPLPTSDVQNVIEQCLDYIRLQSRDRRIPDGERKFFSSHNVRLEYYFGPMGRYIYLPYDYFEVGILLQRLKEHFRERGDHWTGQTGLIQSEEGAVAGYVSIAEAVNIPDPPPDSSAAPKLGANTTKFPSS